MSIYISNVKAILELKRSVNGQEQDLDDPNNKDNDYSNDNGNPEDDSNQNNDDTSEEDSNQNNGNNTDDTSNGNEDEADYSMDNQDDNLEVPDNANTDSSNGDNTDNTNSSNGDNTDGTDDSSNGDNTDNTDSSNGDSTDGTDDGTDYSMDNQDADTSTGDDTDGTDDSSTGDDTDGTDDSSNGDDTDGADFSSEINQLQDDILKDLSKEQIDIKNKELKSQYIKLNSFIGETLARISKINKTQDNKETLQYICSKLEELKLMSYYYITNTYDTKTYVDNNINFGQYIFTLNIIQRLFKEIEVKTE